MTKVTGFAVRHRKDGSPFIALELQGGLELVQSQNGNGFYATVRRCTIPSTFDEPTAKMMIGQELDGDVVRVAVDPYEYTNKRTGEILQLQHSFAYRPKGAVELIGHTQVHEVDLV